MDTEMNKEISAAIKKNLPSEVGNLLKTRLEQADGMELTIQKLKTEVMQLSKQYQEMSDKVHSDETRKSKIEKYEEIKKEALELEGKQELFEAKLRLEETQKRTDELRGVMEIVFKSPVYRKNIVSNGSNYDSSTGHSRDENDNTNEIVTQE